MRPVLPSCLVLPLVLFAGERPIDAFTRSERETIGERRLCANTLVAWLLLALAVGVLPALFLQLATAGVMGMGLSSLGCLVVILLLTAVVWSVLLFFVGAWTMVAVTLMVVVMLAVVSIVMPAVMIRAISAQSSRLKVSGTRMSMIPASTASLFGIRGAST